MKISSSYFGPGSPKNRFLRFFRIFYEQKSGIRESRVRRRLRESRMSRHGAGTELSRSCHGAVRHLVSNGASASAGATLKGFKNALIGASQSLRIVVSTEIPGIVVSLERARHRQIPAPS